MEWRSGSPVFPSRTLPTRWLGVRVALGLLLLASSACKHKGPSGTDPDAHAVIGAFLSLTGPMATFGITTERGARMAVDEINKSGGIKGKPLELVVLDDQGK